MPHRATAGLRMDPKHPILAMAPKIKDTLSMSVLYRWDTGLFTMPRRLDNRTGTPGAPRQAG
jgi:hypothetical protein